jgi:hypothetical protein
MTDIHKYYFVYLVAFCCTDVAVSKETGRHFFLEVPMEIFYVRVFERELLMRSYNI